MSDVCHEIKCCTVYKLLTLIICSYVVCICCVVCVHMKLMFIRLHAELILELSIKYNTTDTVSCTICIKHDTSKQPCN